MPAVEQLRSLGVDVKDGSAILTFIAKLPVPRTERIRMLRQVEAETLKPFDPTLFARAVDGIPPS
jgi:Rad3-related DNA helicase